MHNEQNNVSLSLDDSVLHECKKLIEMKQGMSIYSHTCVHSYGKGATQIDISLYKIRSMGQTRPSALAT